MTGTMGAAAACLPATACDSFCPLTVLYSFPSQPSPAYHPPFLPVCGLAGTFPVPTTYSPVLLAFTTPFLFSTYSLTFPTCPTTLLTYSTTMYWRGFRSACHLCSFLPTPYLLLPASHYPPTIGNLLPARVPFLPYLLMSLPTIQAEKEGRPLHGCGTRTGQVYICATYLVPIYL